MAIDKFQDKIRKMKCPLVLELTLDAGEIPPHILESAGQVLSGYKVFAKSLLEALKATLPAVRFSFGMFSLYGSEGLSCLEELLNYAAQLGYYVILDAVESLSEKNAGHAAKLLLCDGSPWKCDAIVLDSYIGSDGLRPYTACLKETGKDLFAVVRTANRSAQEIQDLLSGSRLVHMAKADVVNRYAEPLILRNGYSQVAFLAAASSADSLRALRQKYKSVFLLVDGGDYPNANAKNCSHAFDRLGHGAAVCIGSSVTGAWAADGGDGTDYLPLAVEAAERMKKNILRYVTIL